MKKEMKSFLKDLKNLLEKHDAQIFEYDRCMTLSIKNENFLSYEALKNPGEAECEPGDPDNFCSVQPYASVDIEEIKYLMEELVTSTASDMKTIVAGDTVWIARHEGNAVVAKKATITEIVRMGSRQNDNVHIDYGDNGRWVVTAGALSTTKKHALLKEQERLSKIFEKEIENCERHVERVKEDLVRCERYLRENIAEKERVEHRSKAFKKSIEEQLKQK